ncbi:MAG TPA: hypothetical protein VNV44_08580 [Solirubrobacteraceae bacterium]|jgi:hypothetical protein|nr:hypothetical protein [Solirubrobacteraceae bacterium]
MRADPVFPRAPAADGMYESFYLRTVSPTEPLGVWIRHTVHKRPGEPPRGAIWCTVFDAAAGRPFMHKVSSAEVRRPPEGWIEVGAQAKMGPRRARGDCGPARWSLGFEAQAPELRHLSPGVLYRTPLPRTKLTSPAPLARFDGVVEIPGRSPIEVSGWHGMIGHNWGAEHAARWIWLHGCDFAGAPEAWLDVALGRVQLGSRLSPWLASGMLSLDGAARRVGGLAAGRPVVAAGPDGGELVLRGPGGLELAVGIELPADTAAGWRYADPGGAEHDVVNCSIAALEASVGRRGRGGRRVLRSAHGGAYELGGPPGATGVPIAPFEDS